MREAALPLLSCPECRGRLALEAHERADDGHVMAGVLACAGCDARYPVTDGVPRLLPALVAPLADATAQRFGEQWRTFDHMAPHQEAWLRAWLDPLGPADFADRAVLEAGCGKGRHTVVVAGWGARHVIALDLSGSVDVAFRHTRHLANVTVVQGDLLRPPTAPAAFDVAFSIGVLHHVAEPRAGFDALRAQVRPGGRVAIWVYGRESNEWIVRLVSPVRERVTSRLAPALLYWLSLAPSAGLAAALTLYRRPALARRLPYGAYLATLARLPLREVHNIVFDQLVTPVAFYLPEQEVRAWLASPGLTDARLAWHNRNSWRACATVTAPADKAAAGR